MGELEGRVWELYLKNQVPTGTTAESAEKPTWETWVQNQTQPPRPRQSRARKAAREKALAAYVRLSCSHWTTREAIESDECFRPRKGVYYCCVCEEWLPAAPRPPRVKYPDEPPY